MNAPTQPGPRLRTAIIVLVLGAVMGVGGIVGVVVTIADIFTSPSYTVPGTIRVKLDSGRHVIYELTGSTNSFVERDVVINPSNVSIIGPGGTTVPAFPRESREVIDRNTAHYVSAVEFDADRAGTYSIRISVTQQTRVLVQRSLGSTFKEAALWIGLVILGGLIFLLGIVALIVGLVRRSSARKAQAPIGPGYGTTGYGVAHAPVSGTAPTAPAWVEPTPDSPPTPAVAETPTTPLPPAGWHPDPMGQHRLRYWDGRQWTEHTAE